ncbi:polysaccharide deacetylase family protein [Butyrivibrio fibrisolvens]|uniref:NodB homology domain-containing protein n=1 Tax=Butyrivibrio fibrisolvens TaxID=831 RepID=A0A317G7E0_BUTFI|nr:polysaccharide deacetylase family protein [Butyrivibrio fibrisolvens]PWT29266.1 hypothetical protein CPT75_20260 [Butyrivibrio fibrisolvens]
MTIRNVINFCGRYSKIYCFGAGKYGKMVCNYLKENRVEIDAFVVSDKKHIEKTEILGVKVISIDCLHNVTKNEIGILVAINSELYESEVKSILSDKGIEDYLYISEQLIEEIDSCSSYDIIYPETRLAILYHRVTVKENDIWGLAISPELFDKQIQYLKENYDLVTFNDYNQKGNPCITITFDDGYADNYWNALPILEKYKVPAIIFVCTGNLNTNKEFWWDQLEACVFDNDKCPVSFELENASYECHDFFTKRNTCISIREKILAMNEEKREAFLLDLFRATEYVVNNRIGNRSLTYDELKMVDNSEFVTIGGHTVSHTRLSIETYDEQYVDISDSKEKIESVVGHKIDSFSFPFGEQTDYDTNTIDIALQCGFNKIIAVDQRYKDGKYKAYNEGRLVVQIDHKDPDPMRSFRRSIFMNI